MSYRDLPSSFISGITSNSIKGAFLFEIELADSSFYRLWSGYGDLIWNTFTWLGTGNLIGISDYKENNTGKSTGISIELSGVDSALISIAMQSLARGKPVNVYLALLDDENKVITTPDDSVHLLFKGLTDAPFLEFGKNKGSITLNIETKILDSKRSSERLLTHQDQLSYFPGDLFLQYANKLNKFKTQWGAANSITVTTPVLEARAYRPSPNYGGGDQVYQGGESSVGNESDTAAGDYAGGEVGGGGFGGDAGGEGDGGGLY